MGNDDPTVGTTAAASTVGAESPTEGAPFDPAPDRFATKAELGRGGMGRVVAAADAALGREVAIKQALSTRPADLKRFEREVRITAQLEHPAIVPLYEAGRDPAGRPYYVMRKIAGRPLSERLAEPATERLALVPSLLAVVDAAAFAHARGILHRDIKPSNILLGEFGETLLIDWGIARRLGEDEDPDEPAPDTSGPLTRVGDVVGTVAYMAPEQARGERVDARADVYALGATLYHLLAGRAPHDGSSLAERVVGDAPAPDFRALAGVPRELVAIVKKAMEPEPATRYRDAGQLAKDLRAFLAGQLVAAHAYTPWERLRRVVRRHRLAFAIATVAVVVLAVVSAVAVVQVLESRDVAERNAAESRLRAEGSQIERAIALAPIAPSHAAALLLDLEPAAFAPGSPNAPKLRDIIASLAIYGTARGNMLHKRQVLALAFSRDERTLASGDLAGVIAVHELSTASSRIVVRGLVAHHLEWTPDARSLLAWTTEGIASIELATGRKTMLFEGPMRDAAASDLWLDPDGTRVRFVDPSTHRLLEVPLAGGALTVIAHDVARLRHAGEVAVVVGKTGARILERGRELMLASEEPTDVAISPDGRFAAFVYMDRVVEMRLGDRTKVMEWRIPYCSSAIYAEQRLYVGTPGMQLVTLVRVAGTVVPIGLAGEIRSAATWPRGAAWPLMGGGIFIDSANARVRLSSSVDRPTARAAAASGRYLAIGGQHGELRWLDLAPTLPDRIPFHRGKLCGISATHVYVLDDLVLHELDLQTRRQRVVGELPRMTLCLAVAGRAALIVYGAWDQTHKLIDVRTGASRDLGAHVRFDMSENAAWVLRGRQLARIDLDTGEETTRHEAPRADLELVTVGYGHAVFGAGDELYRVRLADSHVERGYVPSTRWIASGPDAVTWIASDKAVYAWTDLPPRWIHRFERTIRGLRPSSGGLEVMLDDGSAWQVTSSTVAQRTDVAGTGRLIDAAGRVIQRDPKGRIEIVFPSGMRGTRELEDAVELGLSQPGVVFGLGSTGTLWNFGDPVPLDPLLARAWLAAATNARLGEHRELEWRAVPVERGTTGP